MPSVRGVAAACLSALIFQANGAPDPAGEKCIQGQHGPPCTEDSDCTIITNCKRCANSGFCTAGGGPSPSPGPHPGPSPGPHGCDTKDKSFDFLLLVQGWPESACLSKPCQDRDYGKSDFWMLHGLWPSRGGAKAKSYPCVCDDRDFDASKISSLNKDLLSYWPSYTTHNDQFWEHEWTKHGTCCANIPALATEFGFFNSTLNLRAQHDIASYLKKASIVPDATKTYSADALLAALKPIGGQAPMLGCVNANGKQYVHEISFCLDKTTMKDIECDSGIVHLPDDEVSDCDPTKPLFLVPPTSQQKESLIV